MSERDPKVTAVVLTYWQNRKQNVKTIVESLRSGTVVPDHILVWNNRPGSWLEPIPGADATVNSPFNYECRAKFIVGQLVYSDFYVLADDDTAVGRETVEAWLRWAHAPETGANPAEFATAYWGVALKGRSFMNGRIMQPSAVRHPMRCDAFHGRIMFMGHRALLNTMRLEEGVRDRWPTEGDDLIAGIANPRSSWVVPLRGDEQMVDLDEGGEAMQNAEGYFEMRDRFCSDVIDAAIAMGLRGES